MRVQDIEAIHSAGLQILERTGVLLQDEATVGLLAGRGFPVDGPRVRMPADRVEAALSTAPREFSLEPRGEGAPLAFGRGMIAVTTGVHAFVQEDSRLRTATFADLELLTKAAHRAANVDMVTFTVAAQDVPEAEGAWRSLHALLTLTDKPIAFPGFDPSLARAVQTSAEIVWGADWARKPRVLTVLNSTSPLVLSAETCEGLVSMARLGQPVCLTPCVMGGATGPATLAGILALQHAETLAGLVLSQIAREGAPYLYGGTSSVTSMLTGDLLVGVPQYWTLMSDTVQIAHHLGLPCRAGGGLTDAHVPDMQAGIESALGLAAVARAGVDLVIHGTGVMSSLNAVSFEKFVIDDELLGMIRSRNLPVEIGEDTLALDVIDRVGPGGAYLLEEHTAAHCRDYTRPSFFNRRRHDAWVERGGHDLAAAARRRFQELVQGYQRPTLDPTIERQLHAVSEGGSVAR